MSRTLTPATALSSLPVTLPVTLPVSAARACEASDRANATAKARTSLPELPNDSFIDGSSRGNRKWKHWTAARTSCTANLAEKLTDCHPWALQDYKRGAHRF